MGAIKKAFLYCLLFIALLTTRLPSPTVSAKSTEPIRVGWFIQPGYMDKSEDGVYGGYNYEYLQTIARITGWKYEFVDGSISDLSAQLEQGKIDLLGCLFDMPERSQRLALPLYSAGTDCVSLFALNDSPFMASDLNALDGICVGVTSKTNQTKLDAFARESGFTYTVKEYEVYDELQAALNRHEIDAGACGGFQTDETTRVLARFAPAPFYFAASKESPEVLSALNRAMGEILMENPYYSKDLAQKYLHTSKTYFFLTQREKDLIRTLPPLTVAYNPNWIPFEMQNEHGEFSGVIAQAYQRISALTGLRFHFIPTPSDPSVHLDMFTSFEQNFDAASVLGMNLTDAYITLPMVLVRKVGTDAPNKRTATSAKNYSYEGMMSKGYDFVQYDTPEACIAAVKSGEVEQAFVDAVAAESCLRRAPYKGLTRVVLQGQRLNVCAAVSDKLDPLVYNVVNKAVLYLSGSEMNDLLISNTFQESKIDFRKMMEQMPMDVFLILFLFCAFLGVSIAFVIRIRSAGKIKAILYYDSLTGLLTKYGFEQRVRETLAKSSKGFFMVDFDVHKFHDFNSLQGRPAGDALLCAIAKKSLENCAADELCARIYADHFMCLVRDQSVEHLIMQITEGSRIFNHADNPLMIGFKYGIYEIKDRSMPVSQMMDRAYVAKQMIDPKSKEFYRVYDDDFYQRQLNESALLLDAESAFRNKEFVAYYQPKFDAKTECVVAAEALVRWRRANGELIFPDRFIELFEKNGKIRELDFYMLREACAYQRQLLDKGISCVPISVNFSGVHFYDADFAGRIDRMVREYRLDKHWIEIEFTETEMIENLGIAEKVFTDLRELGFSIAMDDFGSGYSSLNSLKDIPIDIVKLDRGFFCEPLHRENADLIVAAVIRLAALMKLKTVAEGIETKEQLDFVRDCGCDMIQGYYFSCPIEASAFCAMLTKTEDCTI